jgi:enamine deaminase RidA (YjgF/YER057c/UK114 family)
MSDIEVLSVPSLAGSGVPYAYAVKAGPWIFLTGHEGFDFETGSTAAVDGPPGFPTYDKARPRREAEFIFERMRTTLAKFGSGFKHAVRLDQYYPAPSSVLHYQRARRAALGSYIPPSTSVIMERALGARSTICCSLMAVAPDDAYAIQGVYPKGVPAPEWSGFVPTITCNDFIFIAGQMATDDGDGLDVRARVRDDSRWGGMAIRRQTEFLIKHKLMPALESAGSALHHAVKAQVYIEGSENFPDFFDVWSEHFAGIPCALTVVPTKSFATIGGIIEINLIALKADAVREKVVVEAGLPAMASYGPAVRVGEFLFPSGLMAIGPDGAIAGRDLSPAFESLAHSGFTQASTIYGHAAALCEAAGTSLQNVVRAQYFCASPAEFPGITAAWQSRQDDRPHPFVCVHTPAPPAPGATVIADLWIYVPGQKPN